MKAFEAYSEEESLGSARKRLAIWKVAERNKAQGALETPHLEQMVRDAVREAAWSPNGEMLASGDEFGLRLWDVASGARVGSFRRDEIISISWSPGGRHIASTSYLGGVVIYDVTKKEVSAEIGSSYSAALFLVTRWEIYCFRG